MRGWSHRDGVFWHLMLERMYSLPAACEWLLKRDNWMSDTIQNEVLHMLLSVKLSLGLQAVHTMALLPTELRT